MKVERRQAEPPSSMISPTGVGHPVVAGLAALLAAIVPVR